MSDDAGGPAFPYSGLHSEGDKGIVVDSHGMTLRDYFAAKAMASVCLVNQGNMPEAACQQAYVWADAMLAARNN